MSEKISTKNREPKNIIYTNINNMYKHNLSSLQRRINKFIDKAKC